MTSDRSSKAVRPQQKLHHSLNLFLFASHGRLMIAVSYNLWISADHRCWLVGWGAFLIKRQMSGGGILTLWHYKSWRHFKILYLLCCPLRLTENFKKWRKKKKKLRKEQHTPPKLLSAMGGIITFLTTLYSYICATKLDFWGQEGGKGWFGSAKRSIMKARSVFTIVTATSKNKKATVSPSTRTHDMPMPGVAGC